MSLPAPAPDRTAVVTGASQGIGAEIARQLARRGHGVTLVARTVTKLEALAEELRAEGVRAEVLAADLTDRTARAGLLGAIEGRGLSVEVLVNNAGLSTLGPVAAADPDAEMAMLELDVVSVVDLCSRFLPAMVEATLSTAPRRSSRCRARPATRRPRSSCCRTRRASPAS